MSAPSGWHDNNGEHTMVWTTETRSVAGCLVDLADMLQGDADLLLHSVFVSPTEPSDQESFIVQAVMTTSAAAAAPPTEEEAP